MKLISILGSTGSIGTQTLDIVTQYPNQFQVVGLAALKKCRITSSTDPQISTSDRSYR